MQTNTANLLPGEQLGVAWNGIPFSYGDYGAPNTDWITPLATELEGAAPLGCEAVSQQKDYYQPMIGGGMHRISPQLNSSSEPIETDTNEHASYPFSMSYHQYPYHHHPHHHQAVSHGAAKYFQHTIPSQQQQQQPKEEPLTRKIPTNGSRYVPNGYYTPNGRTSATDGGSPMSQQPSLYPSPPVQPHGGEETSYSKPYSSMLYMNGDHVPPPPTIGFASHTESTLSNLYGASLGGDHYQPYGLPAMGYEEVTPAYPTAGHPPMELPMGQAPKYDAWSTESAVLQPVLSPMGFPVISHAQSLAIKQEYASPTYISPSPSSMAGGSSIKTELMSDSSRSPPPPGLADQQLQGLAIPPPIPSSACSSPSLLPLPQTKQESKPNVKLEDTTGGKKATRNSNNYGDQYACPECRRTFARQCGLTQHTKWHHSGEKPFRCLTCGKCFSAQNALDDHLQRHTTTDKPYQCQQCPKAFFHKNDLRRHGFQHTGKAPHACRYCGKTFARKDHCHSHECSHERKIQRKERKVKGGGVTRDQGVHSVEILSGAPVTPSLDATTLTPVSEMGMHFLGVEHRIGA